MSDQTLHEFAAVIGGSRSEAVSKIKDESNRTNLPVGALYYFYKHTARFPTDNEAAIIANHPPLAFYDLKKLLNL